MAGKVTSLENVKPENSALLVIDMSRDFIAPGAPLENSAGRDMADHLGELMDRCREVGLPVIYVNHVHHPETRNIGTLAERFPNIGQGKVLRAGTRGVEMWEKIAPKEGDIVVEKIRQSGFVYTGLEATLRELGVRNVIVSGVSVGACVECTARDAVARDFHTIMLSDGTSANSMPDQGWGEIDFDTLQRVFLSNFAFHFGEVASIADLMNGPLAADKVRRVS